MQHEAMQTTAMQSHDTNLHAYLPYGLYVHVSTGERGLVLVGVDPVTGERA